MERLFIEISALIPSSAERHKMGRHITCAPTIAQLNGLWRASQRERGLRTIRSGRGWLWVIKSSVKTAGGQRQNRFGEPNYGEEPLGNGAGKCGNSGARRPPQIAWRETGPAKHRKGAPSKSPRPTLRTRTTHDLKMDRLPMPKGSWDILNACYTSTGGSNQNERTQYMQT